ncbi:hypothetical protein PIB30_115562, partial [Stylosanthes scabra]|nr:hypothetical protein [Stylosanthes scabra]
MRGKPTAHVPESHLDKPKRDQDFLKPSPSTHRRRRPTHMRGRHSKQLDDPRLSQQSVAPSLSRPTHMRGSPRICVENCLDHVTHQTMTIHEAPSH